MTTQIVQFPTIDDGIEFRLRGIERDENDEPIGEMIDTVLTVPPLNLYNLRRLKKNFGAIQTAGPDISAMEDLIELVNGALKQNYTGVPRWLIEQSVSPANFGDLAVALMDISGLKRKEIEEKKAKAAKPPTDPEPTQGT